MTEKIRKSEADWQKELDPEVFRITRRQGTERAFTGCYWNCKTPGVYHCACCDRALFESDAKFDSGTGWPSFFQPVSPDALGRNRDISHGMERIEVVCGGCDAHLGHVFPDGPPPTGERYCINSASLKLKPRPGGAPS